MTPTVARDVSLLHLFVWVAIPGAVVVAMVSSGGPSSLAGALFLAVIGAFLGGAGVLGALLGLWQARRARAALDRGDADRARRASRTSLTLNAVFGGLQLLVFAVGFFLLTKLHH